MNDIRSSVYAQKVELLLRLIPIVMEEHVFAIHGGTAINLFLKDLPRYSVDIDLTYIPLADRQTSLDDINLNLKTIADKAKKTFKGMHVVTNQLQYLQAVVRVSRQAGEDRGQSNQERYRGRCCSIFTIEREGSGRVFSLL